MAKDSKKKSKPKPSSIDPAILHLEPNAWPKFEGFVKRAAKMERKPHAKAKKAK